MRAQSGKKYGDEYGSKIPPSDLKGVNCVAQCIIFVKPTERRKLRRTFVSDSLVAIGWS
jgi:hypothetical protein